MPIPYESLVLIAASGGTIIVLAIAVALLCLCRHARRSPEAVIHILTTSSPTVEPMAQIVEFCGETNQLLTSSAARTQPYKQKTKISMKTKHPRSVPSATSKKMPIKITRTSTCARMATPTLELPTVERAVAAQPVRPQRPSVRREVAVEAGPSTRHQRRTTAHEHVVVIDGSEPPPPYSY